MIILGLNQKWMVSATLCGGLAGMSMRTVGALLLGCSVFLGRIFAAEIPDTPLSQPVQPVKADTNIATGEGLFRKTADPLPVFVFRPQAAVEAESELRESFNRMRSEFVDQLFLASKYRRLTLAQAQHPGFQTFVQWFQQRHKDFPLEASLAEAWATGKGNNELKEALAGRLRDVMDTYVVAALPRGSEAVRIIPLDSDKRIPPPETALVGSFTVAASDLHSLRQTRLKLVQGFDSANQDEARFLAQFIRENCVADETLTRALGDLARLNVTPERREAPGEEVTPPIESIRDPAAAVREPAPQKESDQERTSSASKPEPEISDAGAQLIEFLRSSVSGIQAAWDREPLLYDGVAGGIALILIGWLVWRPSKPSQSMRVIGGQTAYTVIFNAARNETIFLPVKTESNPQLVVADTGSSGTLVKMESEPQSVSGTPLDLEWQDRILGAEKRAEELLAQVRAGLAPHLAKEMMSELVRKLVADREGLLQAHLIASSEVADIEQRFVKVHAQLQERLKEYQARNLELERELAASTEQNRKLLSTQIEALQKRIH